MSYSRYGLFFVFITALSYDIAAQSALEVADTSKDSSPRQLINWEEIQIARDVENTIGLPYIEIPDFQTFGNLNVICEVGFIEAVDSLLFNQSANGQLFTHIYGVPIKLEGNYNRFSTSPESRNFIRVSFDKKALQRNAEAAVNARVAAISKAESELLEQRKIVQKQLAAASFENGVSGFNIYKDRMPGSVEDLYKPEFNPKLDFPSDQVVEIPEVGLPGLPNQENFDPEDSIQPGILSGEGHSYSEHTNFENDSIAASIAVSKQCLRNKLDSLDARRAQLESYKKMVLNPAGALSPDSDSSLTKLLNSVNAFQIGQTNPVVSRYTINGNPVNGIFADIETPKRRLLFTHGQVVGPSFRPLTQRQSFLTSIVGDAIPHSGNIGDRVSALAVSLKNSSQLKVFVSTLYGLDKFLEQRELGLGNFGRIPGQNNVVEIFGEWECDSLTSLEWSVASSMFRQASGQQIDNGTSNGHTPNYAGWIKLRRLIPSFKANIFGEFDLVQSGFRSLGNPFLRRDQLRVYAGMEKKWKKATLSSALRYRKAGLDQSTTYSSHFYGADLKGQIKLSKQLQVTGIYIPMLFRTEINSIDEEFAQASFGGFMSFSALIGTLAFRRRDFMWVLTSNSTRYGTTIQDSTQVEVWDFAVNLSSDWKSRFRNNVMISYRPTFPGDSLLTQSGIFASIDCSVAIGKKMSISAGTSSFFVGGSSQGYAFALEYAISKKFRVQSRFEKRIQQLWEPGDFWNPMISSDRYGNIHVTYTFS